MSVLADIYKRLFAPKSHTHAKNEITGYETIIGWPDYEQETLLESGTTITQNGFVWGFMERNGWMDIERNGKTVRVAYQGEANQSTTGLIPVMAGDIVTASLHLNEKIHFYPCL